MNIDAIYKSVNDLLAQVSAGFSFQVPAGGTDHEKIQYLLDQYVSRLRRKNWVYYLYRNKRKIPDLVCSYLDKVLQKAERKAEQTNARDGEYAARDR